MHIIIYLDTRNAGEKNRRSDLDFSFSLNSFLLEYEHPGKYVDFECAGIETHDDGTFRQNDESVPLGIPRKAEVVANANEYTFRRISEVTCAGRSIKEVVPEIEGPVRIYAYL